MYNICTFFRFVRVKVIEPASVSDFTGELVAQVSASYRTMRRHPFRRHNKSRNHLSTVYHLFFLAVGLGLCHVLIRAMPRGRTTVTFTKIGKLGRLGNQLFQVASTIGLAEKHGLPWDFPQTIQDCAAGRLLSLTGSLRIRPSDQRTLHLERDTVFYDVQLDLAHSTLIDLEGYFQSVRYFKESLPSLNDYFTFPSEVALSVKEKYPELGSSSTVTLHVRRGDYLKFSDIYVALGMPYYERALSRMGFIERVIIISDDIEWCKRHFGPLLPYNVRYSDGGDIEEFVVMLLSKKVVIANSTFSWWAAFLKIVFSELQPSLQSSIIVSPSRWYNETGKLAHMNGKDDLCPLSLGLNWHCI